MEGPPVLFANLIKESYHFPGLKRVLADLFTVPWLEDKEVVIFPKQTEMRDEGIQSKYQCLPSLSKQVRWHQGDPRTQCGTDKHQLPSFPLFLPGVPGQKPPCLRLPWIFALRIITVCSERTCSMLLPSSLRFLSFPALCHLCLPLPTPY